MSNLVRERLLVALSGGVDSAVAAALLLDQGHEVEGVYVRTWEHEDDLLGDCPGGKRIWLMPEGLRMPWAFPSKS